MLNKIFQGSIILINQSIVWNLLINILQTLITVDHNFENFFMKFNQTDNQIFSQNFNQIIILIDQCDHFWSTYLSELSKMPNKLIHLPTRQIQTTFQTNVLELPKTVFAPTLTNLNPRLQLEISVWCQQHQRPKNNYFLSRSTSKFQFVRIISDRFC